jgi:hypothetical protein
MAAGGLSLLVALSLIMGCESITNLNIPGMQYYRPNPEYAAKKVKYQQEWREKQSPEALTWLLKHVIDNGMSVAEVNQALGTEGETAGDHVEKYKKGGNYLVTDDGYRWGPDSNSRVIILFFRNDQLVNFDPHEIQ